MPKAPQQRDSISAIYDNTLKTIKELSMKEFNHHNIAIHIRNHMLKAAVVEAASPDITIKPNKEGAVKKPPKMKYTDLPIYQSPHYEYKDYIEDQKKCPEANVKLLQRKLYPTVHEYRKSLSGSFYGMKDELSIMRKEICDHLCIKTAEFKKYMRDPENLMLRRAIVVAGTVTGFYIGSGSRNISKKLFFSSLGALAAGALCFPKETDEIFRNVSYKFGNFVIAVYNITCRKNYSMRERLPCPGDLPPPPQPLAAHQINKKCYENKTEKEADKKIPKSKLEPKEIIK